MTERAPARFEIRMGKFGAYFHDNERGGKDGFDLPLDLVLEKLNRIEEYKARLRAFGEKGPEPMTHDDWVKDMGRCVLNGLGECLAKVPVACVCNRMPELVYMEALRAFGEEDQSR